MRKTPIKAEVGKVYEDRAGCTVKVIYKLKSKGTHPYLGIVDWSTATCKSSRGCGEEVEFYTGDGLANFTIERGFDLIREIS